MQTIDWDNTPSINKHTAEAAAKVGLKPMEDALTAMHIAVMRAVASLVALPGLVAAAIEGAVDDPGPVASKTDLGRCIDKGRGGTGTGPVFFYIGDAETLDSDEMQQSLVPDVDQYTAPSACEKGDKAEKARTKKKRRQLRNEATTETMRRCDKDHKDTSPEEQLRPSWANIVAWPSPSDKGKGKGKDVGKHRLSLEIVRTSSEPNVDTYTARISALVKSALVNDHDIDQALELVHEMAERDWITPEVWSTLCRIMRYG